MSRKRFNNRRFSKISLFALIQSVLFIGSFLVYILSYNSTVCFYSGLALYTMFSIMLVEMVLLFVYNFYKNQRKKDKVFSVFMILLVLGASIVSVLWTSNYYKDIPYIMKGNYKVVAGKCTYVYAYRGKAAHLDITIENIKFDVSLGYERSIKKGEYYKVEYLPNTKVVMAIYGK